jgi:hypothetical protein
MSVSGFGGTRCEGAYEKTPKFEDFGVDVGGRFWLNDICKR